MITTDEKPLTLREAASYVDLSPHYMYKLTSNRKIAHYKTGKRLYFLKADLDAYLLQNRVEPDTSSVH